MASDWAEMREMYPDCDPMDVIDRLIDDCDDGCENDCPNCTIKSCPMHADHAVYERMENARFMKKIHAMEAKAKAEKAKIRKAKAKAKKELTKQTKLS